MLRDGILHVVEHMVAHVTRDTEHLHEGGLGTRLANGYGSVITCTMVDGKPAVLTL